MTNEKPVRLGFIGAGFMGQSAHLENYWRLPGVELAALAEGRDRTAQLVARRYGIGSVYPHHRDMLDAAELDAVVAIVPFAWNAGLVEDVLNAGHHVLTEKPQVNTSTRGRRLVELARQKQLVYQVGYMKRFDPAVRWAKQRVQAWLQSGSFGPFQSMRLWCALGAWNWFRAPALDGGDAPQPYDTLLEPRPPGLSDCAWQSFQYWSNYFSHQTNLARYVAGQDYTLDTAKNTGANWFVQCTFEPSGAQLYFDFADHHCDRWEEGFEVVFERARLRASLPAPLARNQTARVKAYEFDPDRDGQHLEPSFPAVDGFAGQAQQFIASIRGDEPPLSPAAEAVKEIEFAEELIARCG